MDPAQNKNDQNQTTGVPPADPVNAPVTPPLDNPTPLAPTPPPTPTTDEVPASLPDLPHDMPLEVPDPTSPPPPGATDAPEQSSMPPIITPPAPTRSKAKIVGAILAILILVISIPAGIFLVQKSQEIREKAQECPDICDGPPACRPNPDQECDPDRKECGEAPCTANDPDTGECTANGEPPCETIKGECHPGPDICDGPPTCHPDPECSGITECENYIEACPDGGARTCYKSVVDDVCINTHCDECPAPPEKEACTYNEVCPDEEGGGIRECHGSKTEDEACHSDPDFAAPNCSECEGNADFSGSCSVSDTGNGSFSYSCQVNCSGTDAACNQTFNLSSSWFHCKSKGGGACTESSSDKDNSGTPSLSDPTITAKRGSAQVSGTGNYTSSSCGRTQFDVAINNVTEVAGGVRDMGSDCSVTCASQGFWCANNAVQCGAPHVRHPEFSCDQPATQVCCQLKDTGATPTAQCTNVKVYDTNNNQLSATQLTRLKAGDNIKLAINGSASSGTIDKARFKINGGAWQEATTKNAAGEYFVNYTIPGNLTNFQFEGMIHHQSLNDWF